MAEGKKDQKKIREEYMEDKHEGMARGGNLIGQVGFKGYKTE